MQARTRQAYEVWLRAAGVVLVLTAIVTFLSGFYSRKFHLETGGAAWIWIEHPLDKRQPVAFFVARDIHVPPNPPFVRLRLACDADWTLYVNGEEVAGGVASSQPRLNVFDLTGIARSNETNRFAVALRSATGVGGLLASVDYAPLRENDVVTDSSWKVCRTWSRGITTGETGCSETPLVFGTPPFGRWNYPEAIPGKFYSADRDRLVLPTGEEDATISRREIRVIDAVAVESALDLPARRFDFGSIEGRGRVQLPGPVDKVSLVEARYSDRVEDLETPAPNRIFVFAPGESTVTDPLARGFRYLAVASPNAVVSVVPEPVETNDR